MKKFFTIMMLAATVAACTVEDMNEQPVEPQTYTMTVKASKTSDVATKGLSLSGSTLNVKWNEGEKVEVYQLQNSVDKHLGTLYAAASETGATTLTGTLNVEPINSESIYFYLHAKTVSYSGQNGVLLNEDNAEKSIEKDYDFAYTFVTTDKFSISGYNVTVPGGIALQSQQAIVKFIFNDKDNNATISPSAVIVKVDLSAAGKFILKNYYTDIYNEIKGKLPYENSLTIPAETYTKNAGIIYLAIPDKIEAMLEDTAYSSDATVVKSQIEITLTATVGEDTYTLTKSGFPFSNGQYYEITAKMTKQ